MEQLVLVVGLGKTGCSIARYLNEQGVRFALFDTRDAPPNLEAVQSTFPSVTIFLGHYPEDALSKLSRIICSPGVPLDIDVLQAARSRNIPIESDIDCFARAISAPVVAITGTNGKSTVTSLLGEMAKAAGRSVGVAGNIGTPVLDCVRDAHAIDLWVLELSSFQLEITHALKPKAAAFLNLSDDHLDRHASLDAYCAAKQRIYRGAETCVFNRDDKRTYPDPIYLDAMPQLVNYGQGTPDKANAWGICVDEAGKKWLALGERLILPVQALALQGMHNALNALAALALADVIGLPLETSLQVLKTFKGLLHRCQAIRVLDGVTWINDSKGTNVGSTEAAIEGLAPLADGRVILIAGGQGKGADFKVLRRAVQAHVKAMILIGEDAALLARDLGDLADVTYAQSMEEAIQSAKACANAGDIVLLSPACASFDWFDDFNHRGEVFTGLVEAL
ncbi:MAG: UDP-N-acetylmuramoyl-L-alanine--D-glutamate ligase [Legionellaceae bacterium]|nr:UDP-N-acetylmuramoyl-L-alanine--D-glutamate ligase [Legionellaceae bacterium]